MLKQAKDKIIVASAMSELKGARATTACCCGRGQMSNELLPMLPATRSM